MNSKFVIRQEELFEVVHFMKAPLGARTICIPINKSKQSQNAVDFALKRILKPTDNLILLNCRTISDSIFFFNASKMDCIYRIESHTLLMKEVERCKSAGFNVNAISMVGNPREEIENTLIDMKPDLVIIGSRFLGPVDRVLLGSVSDYLINRTNIGIPILAVPQQ